MGFGQDSFYPPDFSSKLFSQASKKNPRPIPGGDPVVREGGMPASRADLWGALHPTIPWPLANIFTICWSFKVNFSAHQIVKIPAQKGRGSCGARRGTRTPTSFRTLDPESSLSTNFSTRALNKSGATHGTRTHDPRITNAMLYQLS